MFLFNEPPIVTQIEEYVLWRSVRYPFVAGAEGALLRRFSKSFKIRSVDEIQPEIVFFFAGEELSHHFTYKALVALKGFLRYCMWAGYPCINYKELDMEKLKGGRPRNRKMEEEVSFFKHAGLNAHQTALRLKEKFPKEPVHNSSVYRWYARAGK